MEKQLNLFELAECKKEAKKPPHEKLARKLKSPQRDQVEFHVQSLDETIPLDHQARTVWSFVELLN